MEYFVIGDDDTVLGFSLVGVSGIVAATADEAKGAWDKALEDKAHGVIIITEDAADLIRDTVDRYLFSESFPLVVEIPERLLAAHQLDEGVLADVLGIGRRAQVGVADPQHEVRIGAHEPLWVAVWRSGHVGHGPPPSFGSSDTAGGAQPVLPRHLYHTRPGRT